MRRSANFASSFSSSAKPSEKIIAEEQAGFRAGRCTTEQIFNLRVLSEKYLQHQQDFYHFIIDFRTAFSRIWHTAVWATMKRYYISSNLIFYEKATCAVVFYGCIGDWF